MLEDLKERLAALLDAFKLHGKKIIVLGLLLLLIALGRWGYKLTPPARNARARENLRVIGAALEAFYQNSAIYPITPKMAREQPGALTAFLNNPQYHFRDFTLLSGAVLNTDFRKAGRDPYARDDELLGYEVAVNERAEFEWILTSVGPDNKRDVDLAGFSGTAALFAQQSGLVYDPTNGLYSRGDIVYTREMHLRRP